MTADSCFEMTPRIFYQDIKKWSGIFLLLVCTPTTQSFAIYGEDTNSTYEFFNRSSINHLNLRKINTRPLPIFNGTNIIGEHRKDPQLGEKSGKLIVVMNKYPVSQKNTVKFIPNISNENYFSISTTDLTEQDNDDGESSENDTATIIPIVKSINESMNFHENATFVNYQGVSIEQGLYDIMMKNITTPSVKNTTNDSSQYFNIVEKFGENDVDRPLKMSKYDLTLSERTETANVEGTSSMRQREIVSDDSKLILKSHGKASDKNSYFSQAEGRKMDVINEMGPAHSHANNHNINNNFGRSRLDEMSTSKNNIGRSNVDEQLMITEPSTIIDNNRIQLMKQLVYNMSTSNLDNLSKNFVTNTDIPLQNITNASLMKQLDRQSNEENIPLKIGGDKKMLLEKRSHSDLSDNGLHEDVVKNITYPKKTQSSNITQIQISINAVVINETSPMPYSGVKNYTFNAKSILPLINMTEIHQQSDTSTIPSITSTVPKFDATISAIPSSGTTSSTITMNSSNTIPVVNDSRRQMIVTDQTTMSNVEYEFIGLDKTTIDYTEVDVTTSVSVDMMKIRNLNNSKIDTSVELITNFSNTPIQFSNFNDSISVIDGIYLNTTARTAALDFDFYDDTTLIIDETTAAFSTTTNTTTITSYSSIPSSTIIVDGRESTFTDPTEESMILDLSSMTVITTTISSSLSMFEYNIETETSSTIIGSVTLTAPENSTIVSTVQITNNTTPLVTEDITVFVRIVIETSWFDVCSQLFELRQAVANILSAGVNKIFLASQVIFRKSPCSNEISMNSGTESLREAVPTTLLLYIVDKNGVFDAPSTKILPSLYRESPFKLQNVSIRSFQLVENSDTNNAIAVIVVSCVAFICLVLLTSLLFVMGKRQARFNYGERCRPVSLDAYSLDSISAFNSVRRKGVMRMSKRSYGNPAFEDSNAIPSNSLNCATLAAFHTQQNAIYDEFTSMSQVSVRIDELPNGAEIKNRYANVIPLPETRVPLTKIDNDPLTEYINASYVRGPKNIIKYYIACQAPIDTTIIDFWRMIWEQQSKVIIMLTDFIENGVEKCAEYIPACEVTDCHRLYGNFQVTLKKRETKEKYAISTLHLKNLETNTCRETFHIWYLWPMDGIQMDAAGLIAVLLEARAVQRDDPGPIVVHCSPGTGRTGTLIALDLGIRQYEMSRTVDVPKIVHTIRRDRAGAVQTKEQYWFIYKALNFYATKLANGGFEST